MKTNDGYELKEGEACYVSIQDPMGMRKLSPKPRKAFYADETARKQGWDFTIPRLNTVCDETVEVIGVWKNLPQLKEQRYVRERLP